jgi:hypothetical protein
MASNQEFGLTPDNGMSQRWYSLMLFGHESQLLKTWVAGYRMVDELLLRVFVTMFGVPDDTTGGCAIDQVSTPLRIY